MRKVISVLAILMAVATFISAWSQYSAGQQADGEIQKAAISR